MPGGKYLEYFRTKRSAVPIELSFLPVKCLERDGSESVTSKWMERRDWKDLRRILKAVVKLVAKFNDDQMDKILESHHITFEQDLGLGYVILLNKGKPHFGTLLDAKSSYWTDNEDEESEPDENFDTSNSNKNTRHKNFTPTKCYVKACAIRTSTSQAEDSKKLRKALGIKVRDTRQYLHPMKTTDIKEENQDNGMVEVDDESSSILTKLDNEETKSNKSTLQDKLKNDEEDSVAECDRCEKKFKTFGGLKIHYASHIRDDKKFPCKVCGKRFRKQEALELHANTDHNGFKPFSCSHCGKAFRLKDKLKLHIMVIHEKRKPFPCSKCEKTFRTKYHLKIHDVSQHIQGGDSIGCSQCKRKFPDREALEKHVAIHEQDKPFVCASCSKGFQTAARLKLHEKSHQAVATFLCPVCGRVYKHARDLKLHEVIHQDESTYRFGCGDCARRFYRIDLLRVHQSNEKHFSPEVIGPTVCSSSTSTVAKEPIMENERSMTITLEQEGSEDGDMDGYEEEYDSESDTGNQTHDIRSIKESSIKIHPPQSQTIISYVGNAEHTSNFLHVQIDPLTMMPINRNSLTTGSTHQSGLAIGTHQRVQMNPDTASTSYFITQRDLRNLGPNQSIQLQSIPSSSSHQQQIQIGNQTIYSHSIPLNMTSVAAASEQIGYDILTSFMNNLN